jgi:hypothetical protein
VRSDASEHETACGRRAVAGANPAPGGRGNGPPPPLAVIRARPERCAIPECDVQIDVSRLMCRRHWHRTPKALRDEIWLTWRSGAASSTRQHQAAISTAVATVLARQHHDAADHDAADHDAADHDAADR